MDGDIAPLKKFVELKQTYHAMLLVDEAHAIGTVGQTGRGICEYAGVNPEDVDFLMGTLSKSLSSCGGYIAGSKEAIQLLKFLSPSFVYSAGITSANAAAALESLRIFVTANHTEEHIRHTVQLVAKGIESVKGKVYA